ncbi:membrane protein [Xanthomonas sp. NCPPB 1128]|uniref:COG4705 family protein n=1 Tax=Xanthomonas sp. NCPPB 1128 TaxID=1775876 RepID=UPI00065AF958|nr:membrane protein [Xanthomonas sp. NCPPB 1128]KMM75442.1 membrane protein [Xanthomonas sp. NCPPB 1128]
MGAIRSAASVAMPANATPAISKVAPVTLGFWVMKICATTLGETGGDLLSMTLDVGYALSSVLLLAVFLVSLWAQLRARQFQPWRYWWVILTTSTAGTTLSDYMDRSLGLGYAQGALLLVSLLAAVLASWWLCERSLSVERIGSGRAEVFYWLAILVSNTLGTALGDYLADSSGLGFAGGALLITALLAAIALAYAFTGISRTALFWAAFVLTRPFGATLGDLLSKPAGKGGLDLGTVGASLLLAGLLLTVLVASTRRRDGDRRAAR